MIVSYNELAVVVALCELQNEPVVLGRRYKVDHDKHSPTATERHIPCTRRGRVCHEAAMPKPDDGIDLCFKHSRGSGPVSGDHQYALEGVIDPRSVHSTHQDWRRSWQVVPTAVVSARWHGKCTEILGPISEDRDDALDCKIPSSHRLRTTHRVHSTARIYW